MYSKKIRDYIADNAGNAVLFSNPEFDNSIVGISDNGGVIYDYDMMVKELCVEDGIDEMEAREFIDYNTIRAIPYADVYGTPMIVMYRVNLTE